MSSSHVSSVASSAPRHLANRWPSRLDPDHSDLTREHWLLTWPRSVDFDFLRWHLTKSQNFRQDLSCSVFHVDSNFGLRFFIWSSEIGQLAYYSLWFIQRHSSSDLLMLIQPQTFIEILSWVWGKVLEIYIRHILAQCNRLKPSPTCTSSLGFSRLYILMLGFIVTQVIVLHSYNKDVTFKGFICGCRPSRLNHVTLVFSVFLFYTSSSTSTLAYTHRVANINIYI